MPLLALDAGIEVWAIGLLTALSASAQIATRFALPALLRHFPDRSLLGASTVSIALSCALLVFPAQPAAVAVALVLQGLSRALFWTSSQTHAIRTAPTAVGGVAWVGTIAGLGALGGGVLAGALSHAVSPRAALGVAGGVALLGTFALLAMTRLPPFAPERPAEGAQQGAIWRRPGVRASVVSNATVGAWRGIIESYLPVVLVGAGHSALVTGLLAGAASLAVTVGTGVAPPLSRVLGRGASAVGVLAVAVGLALTGLGAPVAGVAAAGLLLSGLAGGFVQTVTPAAVSLAVPSGERGAAIAASGTARSLALFAAPLAMSALVLAVPVGVGMAVVAIVLAAPAAIRR